MVHGVTACGPRGALPRLKTRDGRPRPGAEVAGGRADAAGRLEPRERGAGGVAEHGGLLARGAGARTGDGEAAGVEEDLEASDVLPRVAELEVAGEGGGGGGAEDGGGGGPGRRGGTGGPGEGPGGPPEVPGGGGNAVG